MEPPKTEHVNASRREPRYWLGSFGLLLTTILVSFLVALTVEIDPSAFFAALLAFLILAVLWSGWLAWINVRRITTRGRINRFGALVIALFLISSILFIGIPALQRSRCGTWTMPVYRWFDDAGMQVSAWLADHDEMPPRLDTLLAPGLARLVLSDQIAGEPEDYRVGSLNLYDAVYSEGTVDEREWLENTESLEPAGGDWERVGPALMSRELSAWQSDHEDVIVLAVLGMRRCGAFGGSRLPKAIALFETASDESRPAGLDLDDRWGRTRFDEMVAADRAARAELGLSEPPDYAAVIREYVEAQKEQ